MYIASTARVTTLPMEETLFYRECFYQHEGNRQSDMTLMGRLIGVG